MTAVVRWLRDRPGNWRRATAALWTTGGLFATSLVLIFLDRLLGGAATDLDGYGSLYAKRGMVQAALTTLAQGQAVNGADQTVLRFLVGTTIAVGVVGAYAVWCLWLLTRASSSPSDVNLQRIGVLVASLQSSHEQLLRDVETASSQLSRVQAEQRHYESLVNVSRQQASALIEELGRASRPGNRAAIWGLALSLLGLIGTVVGLLVT